MAETEQLEGTLTDLEYSSFLAEGEVSVKEACEFKTLKCLHKVDGGIVNKASVYDTENGKVFIKYSSRENAHGMFESECQSLKCMHETGTIRVPKPLKVVPHPEQGAMFVMEYIEGLRPVNSRWSELGTRLARLHNANLSKLKKAKERESSITKAEDEVIRPVEKFGFHCKTHYGPHFTTEPTWLDSWQDYFARMLLQPQFQQIDTKTGDKEFREVWSELQLVLDVPYRGYDLQPSLTHGDFCSINVGETSTEAVTFDPCSVYAPFETDFTILLMENDFHEMFYNSYHKILPPLPGFDLRMKAQLTFAHTLIYNIPGYENTRQEALDTAKDLLRSIHKKLADSS